MNQKQNQLAVHEEEKILERCYDIKDRANPKSVINMVPSSLQARIGALPDDILAMPEDELAKKVKPSKVDDQLRIAFWLEYDKAIHLKNAGINIGRIHGGISTRAYFMEKYITNSYKLAYMLTPPASYELMLEDILLQSSKRVREILELPLVDDKGNVDAKLAAVIHNINLEAANRMKGKALARIYTESKSLNMNYTKTEPVQAQPEPKSLAELDAQLKELERRQIETRNVTEIIEAVVVTDGKKEAEEAEVP